MMMIPSKIFVIQLVYPLFKENFPNDPVFAVFSLQNKTTETKLIRYHLPSDVKHRTSE